MDKNERCKLANELIDVIANCGRKFFNHEIHKNNPGVISYFLIRNNRVYFVDGYVQKSIYAYDYKYFRYKFSEGGTMKALTLDLAEYIRTGEPTNAKNGYGGVYCQHWGYPEEDMKKVQEKAVEIGFSKNLKEDIKRFDYL